MAGYTRQSTADIVSNAVIKAAPVNAEYNAIRDAFAFATGHKHDGSSTEGAYIPLIADTDALNKVVIDTTNNRIGFFVQVSTGTVEQLRIQDGAIVPVTDSDIDLGASGAEFKDLYIDGVGYIDTVTVHENATIAGTLGVTGLSTLASVDINGGNIDATVIGAATPAAATVTTLVATTADINAGTVDATIGGTTPAAGTFTTLVASTADINGGSIDAAVIGAATPAAATVTSLVATTADINAGTVDATIGGTNPAAGTFTSIVATTADINAGTIDNTVIGGATPAAATVSSLVATTADINGGTIDGSTIAGGTLNNAAIGNATPSTVVGTTVTATNFVGPIAGAVTGNVTGNTAGVHTGAVTGNVTGNIASTGSSSFTDLTINGSLNMNAGTSGTITGLSNPVQGTDAATKTYVDAKVAAVVDSAPAALDTLNELAAALGDDANYASTTTAAIATKLPKAGGTMSGAIAMGNNKVTGLATPTAGTDATTKTYVDAGDALQVTKAGDTMSGVLAMGANKITGVADPTAAQDVVTKNYSDTLFGSTTAAATSASNAATSATASANSATASANSATASANSATASASSLSTFQGQYVSQSSAPSSPSTGDLWFDTSASIMKVYNGSGWVSAGSAVSGTDNSVQYTATSNQTIFNATYDAGYLQVYLNGIRLDAEDYTATNGSTVVLDTGATANDVVFIHSFGTFELADHYNKVASDARFLGLAGGTMTGDTDHGDNVKARFGNADDLQIYHNGANSYINNTTGSLYIRDSDGDIIIQAKNNENSIVANNDGSVQVYYDNAEKLATTATGIDVTGVVDVNTGSGTSPSYFNSFLNVQNNASTGDNSSLTITAGNAGYAGLHFGDAENGRIGQVAYSNADNALLFTANNSERMRIDSAGNVGIGTSSPSRTLHVYNANTIGLATFQNDGGEAVVRIQAKNSDSGILEFGDPEDGNRGRVEYDHADNHLALWANDSERMRIDSSGNVGIGTSSPQAGYKIESLDSTSGESTPLVIANRDTTVGTTQSVGLNFGLARDSGAFKAQAGRILVGRDGNTWDGADSKIDSFMSFSNYTNNALTEKMRIDSSGNVLVGTTNTALYNATTGGGTLIEDNGVVTIARQSTSSAQPILILNETGTDGTLAQFRKDGTTVGSIGSVSGVTIGIDGGGARSGLQLNASSVDPRHNGSGAGSTIDLGRSDSAFKDLYLSGGVYLGGTGSANKLDDYETGTWNPHIKDTHNGATLVSATSQGRYVKIGSILYLNINIYSNGVSAAATGVPYIDLPFSITSQNDEGTAFIPGYTNGLGTAKAGMLVTGGSQIRLATTLENPYNNSATGASFSGNVRLYGSLVCKVVA